MNVWDLGSVKNVRPLRTFINIREANILTPSTQMNFGLNKVSNKGKLAHSTRKQFIIATIVKSYSRQMVYKSCSFYFCEWIERDFLTCFKQSAVSNLFKLEIRKKNRTCVVDGYIYTHRLSNDWPGKQFTKKICINFSTLYSFR